MVQSIIILWNIQIFRYNTLGPLSNCFPSQTWTVWTKQGTGISDVDGNNRAVIKTFTAYQLFELIIGWMGHARLHVALLNILLHLFLREHAKLLTDNLNHNKGVVVTMNIQVCHSLAHTKIFLEKMSLTFWRGDNPISAGVVVNDLSIFLQLRNVKQVRNTLPIDTELP